MDSSCFCMNINKPIVTEAGRLASNGRVIVLAPCHEVISLQLISRLQWMYLSVSKLQTGYADFY